MNGLQHLVLLRLAELGDGVNPLSARQAARRSKGLVSNETISKIAAGKHSGHLKGRTPEGLANALQVPIGRVLEAAGDVSPHGPWAWPSRFEQLEPAQRGLVEEVAAALLEAREKGRRDAQQ